MGKKSDDAPEYPVELMERQLASSEAAADRYMGLSEQQQAWSQNLWDNEMFPMLQETTGVQNEVMREQLANARKDRARYEDRYQPLEDNLIQEFQDYDTAGRRQLESGRAMADHQRTFDAQRGNAEQRLASFGIDPSQLRAGAIDSQARTQLAANQAAAGNQARTRVEDTGRALRAEAINIGRGMPSQVAQSYGQTLSAGNSAQGNMNATAGAGGNLMGTGQSWGQAGSQQLGQTMSGINNMYSGQLAGHNAQPDTLGALGGIAGNAFGAWAGSGFAEGGGAVGALPNDNYTSNNASYAESGGAVGLQGSDLSTTPGPNDAIPVTLAPNEYIIPADVAIVMGTEKLDKMVETTRQKAGERGGANARTPAGEMPNQEAPIKGQTLAAEGGGSVGQPIGPMAVPLNMPTNTNWGYSMSADPFAEYNSTAAALRAAQEAEAQNMDLEASLAAGAAMRENYDRGRGLPGMLRSAEDLYGLTPEAIEQYKKGAAKSSEEAIRAAPADLSLPLSAEGGGAVGYTLSPQEEEAARLKAEAEARAMAQYQDANPQGGMNPAMAGNIASQFTGGGGGGGGGGGAAASGGGGGFGSAVSTAGPWAALAAAIAYNEDRQREYGNRPESRSERLQDGLTGKSLEYDMNRYGDKIGGFGGETMKFHGEMGHPEGIFNNLKDSIVKPTENILTPWKIFD